MQLTREAVARKLAAYLHHEMSLDELVSWANAAMMEGDFAEAHYDVIRDAVARLGLADVRAFGLTWEDCQSILRQLGYDARVEIVAV
jgi:cobyrinic acid a,c-diamide synthase